MSFKIFEVKRKDRRINYLIENKRLYVETMKSYIMNLIGRMWKVIELRKNKH